MIYWIVIVAYLLLLTLIGIYSRRGLKKVEDFHIGGRKIGPWVTAFSFVSAYFSSVVIVGGGGFGYKFGMSAIWVGAANVLVGCTLCWIVLGERIRKFTAKLGTMTIPGFFGKRFKSKEVKIFSAVVIVIFMIVYNISILKGMGNMFQVLMGMPYVWGALISGLIIILYVAIGGYIAVVWTGFIQAWIMMFGLLLLTFAALHKIGGFTMVHIRLGNINPGLISTPGVWGFAGLISYALIVSFGVWGMPQLVVRFYSIKSVKMIKKGVIMATVGGCMAILPYFNGAIARILFPRLSSPDLAIPSLTKFVLSPLGGSLFLAAVIAAGMSTFAAALIIISSSIVRDIYKKKVKNELAHTRLWSILIGCISLVLALKPPALILVICAFAWAVIASTCLWPMFFGIYWKGVTKAGVISSMIGGFTVSLGWMVIGNPFGIHGFIPGIIIALLLIVIVSKFTSKFPETHIKSIWEA
ncbi:sodium/proline symporter [candidate division WOR-3 bacterium]|nr:sodium/proline symporter [candidate division WOR-3 bacterium]